MTFPPDYILDRERRECCKVEVNSECLSSQPLREHQRFSKRPLDEPFQGFLSSSRVENLWISHCKIQVKSRDGEIAAFARRGIMSVVWEKRDKSRWLIVASCLLALTVLVAAVLLYRWIGRVSDADRLRQKELLEVAFRGFQSEFAGAIQEITSTFRPLAGLQDETEIELHLAEMFVQWQNNARQPQLIGSLGIGIIDSKDSVAFNRLLPHERKFEKQDWPAGLQSYRDLLIERRSQRSPPNGLPGGFTLASSADRPVIAIPATFFRSMVPKGRPDWSRNPLASPRGPGPRRGWLPFLDRGGSASPPSPPLQRASNDRSMAVVGWYFVEIDAQFLKQQFLPNLAKRHFGGASLSRYQLAVVAGNPRQVIYVSDPGLTLKSFDTVDMTAPLLRPQGRFGLGFHPRSGLAGPDPGPGDPPPETRPSFNRPSHDGGPNSASASWQLLARHRLGSINVEVNEIRYRNLAIAFGILLLMTGSIITLMLSTQRARALARQQMEFVAGVSHELRTPLSVIQSAGFNLARGVAGEAEKVQQYGTVIQTESRRLSDMVEQILSYAGIQSGGEHYQFCPTEIGPLLQQLLANYRETFEEGGWTVEQHIEEDLPRVLADVRTLQSAVRNLVENALKYAVAGKWLRVTAATAHNRTEVVVTVEDHGPGIDPADLPHIFEPFYRGRKVLASSVPGAGLGLSILYRYLKAQGGRVKVANSPGGASFTLCFPVLSLDQADRA